MYAVIGGQTVTIEHGSVSGPANIGQRATLSFNVLDELAAYTFLEGSAADLYSDAGVLLLARWVSQVKTYRVSQDGMLRHELTCTDNAYLADKRTIATTYSAETGQFIVNDFIAQVLAQEGVYALRGINLFSAQQSDLEGSAPLSSPDFKQGVGALGSISRDTAQAWHGSASLKVVTDGSGTFQSVSLNVAATAFRGSTTYTFSAYLKSASGTPTVRFYCQANDLIAGNASIGSVGNVTLSTTWTRHTFTVTMPADLSPYSIIGLRADTGSTAQAITFWMDGLQIEQAGSATAWEVGDGGVASVGGADVTIGAFSANYAQVSACLDALCQKAQGAGKSYSWWIDDRRVLYFLLSNPGAPPVSVIDDTIIERDTEYVTHGNTQFRNTQIMLGGVQQTGTQSASFIGDGHSTAFTLGYDMSAIAPTITLNGVSQTVGVVGDTGKQWYFQQGSKVLTQDSSGTKLTSSDVLAVPSYIGQFPAVITSQDAGAVTTRQMRENGGSGGATSGIVEAVAVDTSIATLAQGFAEANGYLARYNQDTNEFDFLTQTAGFAVGQVVTVNVPGLRVNSQLMQIDSVRMTDVGPIGSEVSTLYYLIKAVAGPLSQTAARFWTTLMRLSQQVAIDSINVGASGTVPILESGTVGWTWTVTGSATVVTYSDPSPTLYPSPTIYPGSAGAPVSITWTKTNAGLNAIRDALTGAAGAPALNTISGYFAWGTGTQGTPATATQLATEAGRKPITSNVNGASVGEDIVNGYIGPTDSVGAAITEVAFFAAASATANSGTMMLYGLYSHTHTASESIQVVADSTFS